MKIKYIASGLLLSTVIVSSAVLAAPPGPPPTPNLPDAQFNSLNVGGLLTSSAGVLSRVGSPINMITQLFINATASNYALRVQNTNTGNNAHGIEASNYGPYGAAVVGTSYASANGRGIYGSGIGSSNDGVRGVATGTGYGVYGISSSGTGVRGDASASGQMGVYGTSSLGAAVLGDSYSASNAGVHGRNWTAGGRGVTGYSSNGTGIYGSSSSGTGVIGAGAGAGNPGVYGESTAGPGVYGLGSGANGPGGHFKDNTTANAVKLGLPTKSFEAVGNATIDGELSDPTSTAQTDPACNTAGGLWNGGSVCDYPLVVNDYGGLTVKSTDPEIGWFYTNTEINGDGIDIYSTNRKGLNVHAQNETGMYETDFTITDGGLTYSNFDTDGGSYSNTESLDTTPLSYTTYNQTVAESYTDPGDPYSWRRGIYAYLNAYSSLLRFGARTISLGNYTASTEAGSALYTENININNMTDVATINMGVNVNGPLRSSSGIGRIYTVNGTGVSQAANAYGYVGAVYCDSSTHRALSCSISAGNSVLLSDSYVGSYYCSVYTKNTYTSAQTVTPKVTCFDPNGTW